MSAGPIPDPEATLDLIFEYVKDAPEQQIQDVTELDAKYVQVFAGASVILGAGALIDPRHGGQWVTALVALALGIYLVTAVVSAIYLRVVTLHGSRYGDTLWDDFKDETAHTLKLGIVLKVKEDYAYNRDLINKKASLLNWGVTLTAAEAICIACAVLGSRLA